MGPKEKDKRNKDGAAASSQSQRAPSDDEVVGEGLGDADPWADAAARAKRDRTLAPAASDPPPPKQKRGSSPSSRGDLGPLLREAMLRAIPSIEESLAPQFAALDRRITSVQGQADAQGEALAQHRVEVNRRFVEQATDVARIKARLDDLQVAVPKQAASLEVLSRDVGRLRVETPAAVLADDTHTRDPDLALVVLRLPKVVDKEHVQALTSTLLNRMDVPSAEAVLAGPARAKTYTLRFLGAAPLGARRARKCLQLTKMPDGTWEELSVEARDGSQVRIYLDPDKSPATLTKERAARKITKHLRDKFPEADVFYSKADGAIKYDWKALVRFSSPAPHTVELQWQEALREELGIDRDATQLLASEEVSANGGVLWG